MTRMIAGTYSASMTVERDSVAPFLDQLRAAAAPPPPLFDVTVTTRKRLAPVLVVRRRGARGRSHLRERFDRQTTTLRGCSVTFSREPSALARG